MIFLYQDYKEFIIDGTAQFLLCDVFLNTETNKIEYVPVDVKLTKKQLAQ
jgi:hypothetical protein